jgi:hypothetical protein
LPNRRRGEGDGGHECLATVRLRGLCRRLAPCCSPGT